MYLVVIFGQVHTLHTLHTLHKGRGFWRVENSYPLPLPLPLPSKNPGGLSYSCHKLQTAAMSPGVSDFLPSPLQADKCTLDRIYRRNGGGQKRSPKTCGRVIAG